ncbi:MAG: ATP-binding cassette domain-containing protein [Akkermansiaceae bacterium]|jgi:ABC-2 type transport system ATP-binding protein|nr:ABC transporter ATP-binding protein [Luteolibacter sp.]
MTSIDIRDLRVDYGDFTAVHDLTLQVPAGEVFGIVGPNGAGKTSTFRVLASLSRPTYGEVRLAGIDAIEDKENARRLIGYMPDLAPVPRDLKCGEFLRFYARAHGLGNAKECAKRADECLEQVALTDHKNHWCHKLSRGQTQRLVLAKTMLHRPKVLILDEPASGLDPLARRDLRQTLRNLTAEGATIFISSHILTELAEMCTSLCVMSRGRLLASGTVEEVRRQLGDDSRRLTVTPLQALSAVPEWLSNLPGVAAAFIEQEQLAIDFLGDDDAQASVLEEFLRRGLRIRSFQEKRSSYEEILIDVAEKSRAQV